MIRLQNVTKLYGTVIGVNDITLTLEPGAYGLLGPNGSGKTTLLSLIIGQLKPTVGTVRVMGHGPRNNVALLRQLGYCPGSEGMYAHVSGYEWVRYLQQLNGMTLKQAGRAASETLALVGMQEAMHRPIANYSRGMRQRTKLAQALAHDPQLLILDEPFNGLDPIGRHEMSVLLRRWIAQGKSLIIASHVLHDVEAITDAFLLICGGRLLASGSAEQVQAMLVNVPNEVTMRTRHPYPLARLLIDQQVAHSVKIEGDVVIAATKEPGRLFAEFPRWLADAQIEVSELRAGDESMQALFNSLLKIHRGEI